MQRLLFLVFLAPLFILGCGAATEEEPTSPFADLESRLMAASSVSFDFRVQSDGVLEGDLTGSVSVSSSGGLTIDAGGTFIGRQIRMQARTEVDSLRMSTNEMSDAVARQEDTFAAVILGLTRLGLLHNLAQLTTVSPPEHGDGGIRDWVTVDNFGSGPVGEYTGVSFDIFVQGDQTAAGVLAIVDGLPVQRRQVVDFPGGQMVVIEQYSNFTIASDD